MGVSGSGKSTLGALIAKSLDCAFLEGDDFHSDDAVEKMRSGQPLTDEDRWPWLDRLGLAAADAIGEDGACVLACSALRKVYRDRLRSVIGYPIHFVLLESSRASLLARLGNRPGHYMPASLLDSQLATLEPPAPSEHAMILSSDVPASQLCDTVMAWLRDRA